MVHVKRSLIKFISYSHTNVTTTITNNNVFQVSLVSRKMKIIKNSFFTWLSINRAIMVLLALVVFPPTLCSPVSPSLELCQGNRVITEDLLLEILGGMAQDQGTKVIKSSGIFVIHRGMGVFPEEVGMQEHSGGTYKAKV